MKVFTEYEVQGRQNVLFEQFINQIILEANCFYNMVHQGVIPAVLKDCKSIIKNNEIEKYFQFKLDLLAKVISETLVLKGLIDNLPEDDLSQQADHCQQKIRPLLNGIRSYVDELERMTENWPYPSYQSMVYDHHSQGEDETKL